MHENNTHSLLYDNIIISVCSLKRHVWPLLISFLSRQRGVHGTGRKDSNSGSWGSWVGRSVSMDRGVKFDCGPTLAGKSICCIYTRNVSVFHFIHFFAFQMRRYKNVLLHGDINGKDRPTLDFTSLLTSFALLFLCTCLRGE